MQVKIERTFVREQAYLKIRNRILEGDLAPGAKLRDKDLAEELGVSRTPVREAILRLEDEGLVQTKPNSSTHVSSIDFHSAFHLYSIVWTLERLALNQAFGSITESHIEKMIEANDEFLKHMQARDRLKALDADLEFHSVYVELCENSELVKIISNLKRKLKRLDLYYFDKVKDAELSYEEHRKIIVALQKKDLDETLEAIESNWKSSFLRFKI